MRRAILLAALLATPALAAEEPVSLKPGAGLDAVNANCGGCHSLDYIRMNSPFLSTDAWKAEVTKMRAAYGAPIDDADAGAIAAYLAANYGPAK
jgi:sulfite dehydrogenase (cytochrome) subunit B